jgi:hypothetical protein
MAIIKVSQFGPTASKDTINARTTTKLPSDDACHTTAENEKA